MKLTELIEALVDLHKKHPEDPDVIDVYDGLGMDVSYPVYSEYLKSIILFES